MKHSYNQIFKNSSALIWCTAALVGGTAYADTKIADTSANFGTTTAERKPDGILEVVGGSATKPSLVVRSATNNTDSGAVSPTSANVSMIVQQDGKGE